MKIPTFYYFRFLNIPPKSIINYIKKNFKYHKLTQLSFLIPKSIYKLTINLSKLSSLLYI